MTIFFTGDTHDQHKNIIRLCNRPFKDVAHMREVMIENTNRKVKKGDTLIHVGDVAFGSPYTYLDMVDCDNVIVLLGNHDPKSMMVNWPNRGRRNIKGVHWYLEMDCFGLHPVIVFHYPIASHNKVFHGALHFHGHTHGNYPGNSRVCDVGVDVHNFEPMAYEELETYLKTLPPWTPVDHHNERTNP